MGFDIDEYGDTSNIYGDSDSWWDKAGDWFGDLGSDLSDITKDGLNYTYKNFLDDYFTPETQPDLNLNSSDNIDIDNLMKAFFKSKENTSQQLNSALAYDKAGYLPAVSSISNNNTYLIIGAIGLALFVFLKMKK